MNKTIIGLILMMFATSAYALNQQFPSPADLATTNRIISTAKKIRSGPARNKGEALSQALLAKPLCWDLRSDVASFLDAVPSRRSNLVLPPARVCLEAISDIWEERPNGAFPPEQHIVVKGTADGESLRSEHLYTGAGVGIVPLRDTTDYPLSRTNIGAKHFNFVVYFEFHLDEGKRVQLGSAKVTGYITADDFKHPAEHMDLVYDQEP